MGEIRDTFNRPLRDLRIPVTDRGNFRYPCCMPKEVFGADYAFMKASQFLAFDELVRIARGFMALGVEEIRLTGGEPLLRGDCSGRGNGFARQKRFVRAWPLKSMKPYLRVTLVYAVFGVLWIFLSDRLVVILEENLEGVTFLQTMKGWVFVGLSSFLLFVLMRQAFEAQKRTEREKLAVFEKTVEGSCHILLNYLNQMQFVMMEAEQCAEFNRDVITLVGTASDEATAELKKLTGIRTITADHIDRVVYEKIRQRSTDTR